MTRTDCHNWKQLAEAARDEKDPRRLLDLIQQLNHVLDEHIENLRPRSRETAS